MSRRRRLKASNFWIAFWITPVAAVALLQLHLHASTRDPSELSDGHLLAVLVLLGLLCGLSCLGCALDALCTTCPESVSLGILSVQIALLCAGLVVNLFHFESGRSLAGILQTTPAPQDLPLMVPVVEAANHLGEHHEDLHSLRSAPLRVSASNPAAVESASNPTAVRAPADEEPWAAVLNDNRGKPAWKDVGSGYCEERDTGQEFSALHAKGKTLQECADIGLSDESSIAFDFSRSDGGCDVRYPAGSLASDIEGFEWFGWGAGLKEPVARGNLKHDSVARCYVKLPRSAKGPPAQASNVLSTKLHPHYKALIREYSFKPVTTDRGQFVNVVLVRAPLSDHEQELFNKLKDELLFIGISCLEDFPLPPPNPFSPKFPADKFVGMFPGFLNMYRNPENLYPRHVKILDMSQSDFYLPGPREPLPKKYDFTFSGSDQDIGQAAESECIGWSMFCKNWSFAKQALEVMCGELGMTGVLVATKDKQDKNRCSIPKSCEGKMVQTTYLARQDDFFNYVRQSRFLFLPQVHDASPRVASQALALDVPLLMNRNIIGGWKYLNEKTGESFNDLSDFRQSLQRLLRNVEAGNVYQPRDWVTARYGDKISGTKLKNWIEENFHDRVMLPQGTNLLFSGA